MSDSVAPDPSALSAKYSTVSEMIPFLHFAQSLQKLSECQIRKDKIRKLNKYFAYFREKYKEIHGTLSAEDVENGDSIFSLVRLLLPQHDRTRSAYNIQATVLGRMYSEIIALDKKSKDGMKLINFKDPEKAGSAAGDLASILFGILQDRHSHVAADGPKLSELHTVLDQLSRTKGGNVTRKLQIQILQKFVPKLSPIEGKWLTRIILKDVPIDMFQTQIFDAVHPKARDMIKVARLDQVCLKLNDPTAIITCSISLFNSFQPMLCMEFNDASDDDQTPPDSPTELLVQSKSSARKKTSVTLPAPPFLVETKWDGERFQIHYQFDSTTGSHTFKYFSRQRYDFTPNFDSLTSELQKQIVQDPPVESFILDGEMMVWKKDKKAFILKGERENLDVKKMRPGDSSCAVFIAFDIVFYNGEVLVEKPLTERMKILRQVLHPKEGVCQFSEQKVINSTSVIEDALNKVVDNKEEGLVVKVMNSTYRPGDRIASWMKIKPDYFGELDLLIFGGYYTDSARRGGKITSVLAGLVDIEHNKFYALVALGSGQLTQGGMNDLITELKKRNLGTNEIPGIKLGSQDRPDVFIDPKESIVVQVKAAEIVGKDCPDSEFTYTLRFARITKILRDKPWHDAMSIQQFHHLRVSCDGKLAKRTDGYCRSPKQKLQHTSSNCTTDNPFSDSDSESEEPIPLAFKRNTSFPNKSASLLRAKIVNSSVPSSSFRKKQKVSNILCGKVFNVVGGPTWKEEMELKIRSHGGEIVSCPTNDMFCVIAEKESLRVKTIIARGTFDVVKHSWIEECIESKGVIPFQSHTFLPEAETLFE